MKNNVSIFKPFALAYLLGTSIVLTILFLSYHFMAASSLILLSLAAFIILIIILGLSRPANRFLPFITALVMTGSFIFISFYTKQPVCQTYKFLVILSFYFLLGYFPAIHLFENHSGSILISGIALILGSLIFNILVIVSVICLGIARGALTAFLISAFFIAFCYARQKRKYVDPWTRLTEKPLSEELQMVSVILLLLVSNALFLNYQYPHGHRESYFEFAKLLLANNFISFYNLPGSMAGSAHIVSMVVPPVWTRLINIDLGSCIYFELLIGHIGLYVCTYTFSRMLFKKHSYAMGSLIFVALLGEMHTYFYGLRHLINHGQFRDFFPLNFDSWGSLTLYLRTRLSPLFFPWALTTYIDSVKGYASILLSMYIIVFKNKDLPALVFGGLLMTAIAGNGEEYLLFTYLVFLFLYLLMDRKELNIKNIVIGTLAGLLLGFPVYLYLSFNKGALNLVTTGTAYFKDLKAIGLWLYPMRKLSMNLKSIGYIILEFGFPAAIFIALAGQKYFFYGKENNHAETTKFLLSFFLAAVSMIFVPVFVGSELSRMVGNWNLNRFLNPFVFWLYFVAGAGFVYLVFVRFKIRFAIVTILILIAIFPTIRVTYSYFLSTHERIISGISLKHPLDKGHPLPKNEK